MRRGLVEWGVVTAILALAAAGASALFADRIREAFGVHRPPAARAERAK
jgi:hypothetical protein